MVSMAAAFTLQQVLWDVCETIAKIIGIGIPHFMPSLLPGWPVGPDLGSSAFTSTDMAEFAAAATPGVMMLGQGPFSLLQAEGMERITADLAEHQLGLRRGGNDGHRVRSEGQGIRPG